MPGIDFVVQNGLRTKDGFLTYAGNSGILLVNGAFVAVGVINTSANLNVGGSANIAGGLQVGANITLSTTTLLLGNTTVNTVINSSSISTSNITATGAVALANTLAVNGAISTPQGVTANLLTINTSVVVGNSTVNTTVNSSAIAVSKLTSTNETVSGTWTVGNSTVNTSANSTALTVNTLNAVNGALSGSLTVNGAVTLSNTLAITGTVTTNAVLASHLGAQFVAPGYMLYSDGSDFYVLLTGNNSAPSISLTGARPFFIDLTTGLVHMQNGLNIDGGALYVVQPSTIAGSYFSNVGVVLNSNTTIANSVLNITGALSSANGSTYEALAITATDGNNDYLKFDVSHFANGAANTWTTTYHKIYRQVDVTPMGYVQFGSSSVAAVQDVEIGVANTSYLLVGTSGVTVNTALSVSGALTVNNNIALGGYLVPSYGQLGTKIDLYGGNVYTIAISFGSTDFHTGGNFTFYNAANAVAANLSSYTLTLPSSSSTLVIGNSTVNTSISPTTFNGNNITLSGSLAASAGYVTGAILQVASFPSAQLIIGDRTANVTSVSVIYRVNGYARLYDSSGGDHLSWGNNVVGITAPTFTIPSGNTGNRPAVSNGAIRYNTDLASFEGVANNAWSSIGGGSLAVRYVAANTTVTSADAGGVLNLYGSAGGTVTISGSVSPTKSFIIVNDSSAPWTLSFTGGASDYYPGTGQILISYVMYPGEVRLFNQDGGVAYYSRVLAPFYTTYTSSGTFVMPPGYSRISGLMWGGGAGGSYGYGYGGGGGCTEVILTPTSHSPGASLTVVIGAGGAASSGNTAVAANGSSSSIGEFTAYAGATGPSYPYGIGGASGAGVHDGFLYVGGGYDPTQGTGTPRGNTYYGAAGGGGYISTFGGNGGPMFIGGNVSLDSLSGSAPGGGGSYGYYNGSNTIYYNGAGARGELRIWGVA